MAEYRSNLELLYMLGKSIGDIRGLTSQRSNSSRNSVQGRWGMTELDKLHLEYHDLYPLKDVEYEHALLPTGEFNQLAINFLMHFPSKSDVNALLLEVVFYENDGPIEVVLWVGDSAYIGNLDSMGREGMKLAIDSCVKGSISKTKLLQKFMRKTPAEQRLMEGGK